MLETQELKKLCVCVCIPGAVTTSSTRNQRNS
ncbi:hypothetical protein An04g00460 [Aspergillus niger]|uniref:Uncharacterized protein n=2 Tax=Aspergillus niger TaxID=5061 RepID=A2QHN2_ASPNC|nr:hypothetical protein An04g00460 [Aspergillus niger]CAK38502.1 hypothetical protein An04g00460 [Aspergillus niger]